MGYRETVAQYLHEQLALRGWSGRTLAMYAEVSHNTIARAVRGDSLPDPQTLRKVASALGVDQEYLLRLAGHMETMPERHWDEAVRYAATRLDELVKRAPPDVHFMIIDAIGGLIDTFDALIPQQTSAQPKEPSAETTNEETIDAETLTIARAAVLQLQKEGILNMADNGTSPAEALEQAMRAVAKAIKKSSDVVRDAVGSQAQPKKLEVLQES